MTLSEQFSSLFDCCLANDNGYYISEGEFGWKMLNLARFAVLYIPRGTRCHVEALYDGVTMCLEERLALKGSKRRAEKAYIIGVWSVDCKKHQCDGGRPYYSFGCVPEKFGLSIYDESFQYSPGKIVCPTIPFGEDTIMDQTCAAGIHYFRSPAPHTSRMTFPYSDTARIVIHKLFNGFVEKGIEEFEELSLQAMTESKEVNDG